MLDFVIFAVTVVVVLIIAIVYLYPGSKRVTTIPGPDICDELEGNLPDVAASGSLHEFLLDLHEQYGDIVHFWLGPQLTVSIATPELFKQHSAAFDRPALLYEIFQPLVTADSLLYANGGDGRGRHAAYSKCFGDKTMVNYVSSIQQATDGLLRKLSTLPAEEHIPLSEYMIAFAMKTILQASFGKGIENEKEIFQLKRSFDVVWHDLEKQCGGEKLEEGSSRMKLFTKECEAIQTFMKTILGKVTNNSENATTVANVISGLGTSNGTKVADMTTILSSSVQSTGLLLTWGFYYLASNKEIQAKAVKEIKEVAGQKKLTSELVGKLVYLRQIIDETLRCAAIVSYAARFQEFDTEIGGHVIPKSTPVIQALGVSMHDPKQWTEPERFDPERFSPENRKKLPSHSFEPFGFAGKRMCPASNLSYIIASILLADALRKFEFSLVEGQVVVPVFGLVTMPKEEIWVTVKERK